MSHDIASLTRTRVERVPNDDEDRRQAVSPGIPAPLAEADAQVPPLPDPDADSANAFLPVWRPRLATIAAISAGGFFGVNVRYLVSVWATSMFGAAFPWATLLLNVSGSFVLGFYLTLVTERFTGRTTTRLFLATGFLGSYTTFSTFSFEMFQLASGGSPALALVYAGASLTLGFAAVVAGILCAHAL